MKAVAVGIFILCSISVHAMQPQKQPQKQKESSPGSELAKTLLKKSSSGSLKSVDDEVLTDTAAEGAAHTGRLRRRSISGPPDSRRFGESSRRVSAELTIPESHE